MMQQWCLVAALGAAHAMAVTIPLCSKQTFDEQQTGDLICNTLVISSYQDIYIQEQDTLTSLTINVVRGDNDNELSDGNLYIRDNLKLSKVVIPNLKSGVDSTISIAQNPVLAVIDLSGLKTLSSTTKDRADDNTGLYVLGNAELKELMLPYLETISNLEINQNSALASAQFPVLQEAGNIQFGSRRSKGDPDVLLASIDFPRLVNAFNLNIENMIELSSLNVPLLNVVNDIRLIDLLALEHIKFESVAFVTGDIEVVDCLSLKTISFPLSRTVGGIHINGNAVLASASFPSLRDISSTDGAASLEILDCPLLKTITFPDSGVSVKKDITFSGLRSLKSGPELVQSTETGQFTIKGTGLTSLNLDKNLKRAKSIIITDNYFLYEVIFGAGLQFLDEGVSILRNSLLTTIYMGRSLKATQPIVTNNIDISGNDQLLTIDINSFVEVGNGNFTIRDNKNLDQLKSNLQIVRSDIIFTSNLRLQQIDMRLLRTSGRFLVDSVDTCLVNSQPNIALSITRCPGDDDDGLAPGAIGAIVCVVMLVCIGAVIALIVYRKRRGAKGDYSTL